MKRETRMLACAVAMLALSLSATTGWSKIDGVTGPVFNFAARADFITTADGNWIYSWGYANGDGPMQYPGPTMIVNQGDVVTVNLTNELEVPVSIVFPGQTDITTSGGVPGLITREVPAWTGPLPETVTYSFVAQNAGTYQYHSGTRPDLQVEMGLMGALIVRPEGYHEHMMRMAYAHMDSMYDYEYLFLLSEMDPVIHEAVLLDGPDSQGVADVLATWFPVVWFINGRTAPDTMLDSFVPWMPTQPYNCMPMMHPGDKLLMRVIGGGRDLHPFHYHGNDARVIARNGRPLDSAPNAGFDLSYLAFTIQSVPGETTDAIFTWTGKELGWDIYGHAPGDPMESGEHAPDHGKPFPVFLPENQDMTMFPYFSGSPFLGHKVVLPPGVGALNKVGEYVYMWHSHTEKEMTNFDIFPGGMMTMLMIMPHGSHIEH